MRASGLVRKSVFLAVFEHSALMKLVIGDLTCTIALVQWVCLSNVVDDWKRHAIKRNQVDAEGFAWYLPSHRITCIIHV